MTEDLKWYNTELPESQAEFFKAYLRCADIYFEASSSDNLIHFQCLLDSEEAYWVNYFLSGMVKMEDGLEGV